MLVLSTGDVLTRVTKVVVVDTVCITDDEDEALLVNIDEVVVCVLIVVAPSFAELKNILDDFAIVGDIVSFCKECEDDVCLALVVDNMKLLVTMVTRTTGDDLVTFGVVDMVAFMVVFIVGLTTKDGFVLFDIVEVTAFPVWRVVFFVEIVAGEMVLFTIILPVGFVVNGVCMTADGDEALINIDEFMACPLVVVAPSLAELKNILDDFTIAGDIVPFCRECEVDVWLALLVDNIKLLVTMVTRTTGDDLVTFGVVDMVAFMVVLIVGLTTKDGFVLFDIVEVTAFPVRRVVFFVGIVAGEMVLFTIVLPVGFVVNTVCMTADGDESLINIDEFMACPLIVVAPSLAELKNILDDFTIAGDIVPFCRECEVDVWLALLVDNIKLLVTMVTRTTGDDLVTFGVVDMVAFMVVLIVGLTTKDGFVLFDIVEVTAFPVRRVVFFVGIVAGEMVLFTIILPVGFVVNTICMTADGDEALINIDEFMACPLIVVAPSLVELKNILDDFTIAGDIVPFCRECEVDVVLAMVVDSIELLISKSLEMVGIVVVMVTGTMGKDLVTFGVVDIVVFVVVFLVGLTTKDGFVVFDIVEVTAFPVTVGFIVLFRLKIVVVGELVLFTIILPVGFVVNTVCMTADGDEALVSIDEFVVCVVIVVAASLAELGDMLDDFAIVDDVVLF